MLYVGRVDTYAYLLPYHKNILSSQGVYVANIIHPEHNYIISDWKSVLINHEDKCFTIVTIIVAGQFNM
jgi:hypothetical protein